MSDTPDVSIRDLAAEAIAECRLLATMSDEPGRTTRLFLSPAVAEVHRHLRGRMEALGMQVWTDAAGNLRGLWQPVGASRRMLVGSHIDTVPDAGAFDGVLGVVLGLALVEMARADDLLLAIEVIAFSEEEGVRFGMPFLGSRAVAGRFDPDLLELRDADGISVREAIVDFGLASEDIDHALASEDTVGFFEIHIEQGPVLEAEGLSLAVVTGIVGQTRGEVRFTGQANHAGTTPMHLRHDALAVAAEWISAVEAYARRQESAAGGSGLVATVGKLRVEPNAGNVIAGSVIASLDVRDARDAEREAAVAALLDDAARIGKRRGVDCQWALKISQPAVPMDEQLTALLAESVEGAGFPVRRLASGAGHDAMVMATRVPSAMLFLRSPGGISHHPAESVLEDDVRDALAAARTFLRRVWQVYFS